MDVAHGSYSFVGFIEFIEFVVFIGFLVFRRALVLKEITDQA